MLKNNQVWENTTKIAKVEQNSDGLRAVIFNIAPTGLQFDEVVSYKDRDLEGYLKNLRMHLTNKVLAVE